jgi:putative colanic acid biosynthesis acetyltransferase WcaF
MGINAVLGPEVICYNVDVIKLAENALVSQGAYLCSASHDFNDRQFPLLSSPIMLARNSWVCAQAFVGPGVTIHEGSVVGARAVVTRDVPPLEVVAGNPARKIAVRDKSALS